MRVSNEHLSMTVLQVRTGRLGLGSGVRVYNMARVRVSRVMVEDASTLWIAHSDSSFGRCCDMSCLVKPVYKILPYCDATPKFPTFWTPHLGFSQR